MGKNLSSYLLESLSYFFSGEIKEKSKFQWNPLGNISKEAKYQISIPGNIADEVRGSQGSITWGNEADEVYGLQWMVLGSNIARRLRGIQVNLGYNECGEDSIGIQVGLVNRREGGNWYSRVIPIIAIRDWRKIKDYLYDFVFK